MSITTTLRRIALLLGIIALPVLAIPSVNAGNGPVIEAPAPKKMGLGLVLLVTLQRA